MTRPKRLWCFPQCFLAMNLNRYKSKPKGVPAGKEVKGASVPDKKVLRWVLHNLLVKLSIVSQAIPKLEEFIAKRDFTGAMVLADHQRSTKEATPLTPLWLGYAAFHLGDYQKALDVYRELSKKADADPVFHLYAACCLFYLGEYKVRAMASSAT